MLDKTQKKKTTIKVNKFTQKISIDIARSGKHGVQRPNIRTGRARHLAITQHSGLFLFFYFSRKKNITFFFLFDILRLFTYVPSVCDRLNLKRISITFAVIARKIISSAPQTL